MIEYQKVRGGLVLTAYVTDGSRVWQEKITYQGYGVREAKALFARGLEAQRLTLFVSA
jgi:hypothetical protein